MGITFLFPGQAIAQHVNNSHPTLEEVMVTARHRSENVHSIPDSMTVFNETAIQAAGINEVQDFINLTSNLIMRETFRSGVTFITLRGVTTGQQGWAPVTYVVDGVKAGALDAINQGFLMDIERIEVLKGPQGALYGAGAIAGAINIITRAPTNAREGRVNVSYGEGEDYTITGSLSGPVIEDKLFYYLGVYYRDTQGLVNSTDGDDMDFENRQALRGRLLYNLTDHLSIEWRGAFSDGDGGAIMQDIVESEASIDHFNSSGAPGPRRGIIGEENRRFNDASLKIAWDIDRGTLTSITGYQRIDQALYGSVSWDKPPVNNSLFGAVFGVNALPGQAIDDFQQLTDDFEVFTQDVRLTSPSDNRFRWVVGAEYLQREAITQLGLGRLIAPTPGARLYFSNRWDKRTDQLVGLYAQFNYDINDQLELTVAGRFDKHNYDTRQFDPITGQTINAPDQQGNLVISKLTAEEGQFQPKLQLSYDWSKSVMTYFTWAKGFRPGFFNTGNPTKPEETNNIEMGFKTISPSGLLQTNAALFYMEKRGRIYFYGRKGDAFVSEFFKIVVA